MKTLRLSSLDARERMIAAAVTVAVVAALTVAVVVGPLRTRMRLLAEEIATEEARAARNNRIVAEREAVDREYAKWADFVRKQGSTAEEAADLLTRIEQWAQASGIRITSTKPREPAILPYGEMYAVEMEGQGRIEEILRFAYAVAESPQLVRLDRFSVEVQPGGDPLFLKHRMVATKVVAP